LQKELIHRDCNINRLATHLQNEGVDTREFRVQERNGVEFDTIPRLMMTHFIAFSESCKMGSVSVLIALKRLKQVERVA
jgi:hypothetical protein